jgi:hypothetical protein
MDYGREKEARTTGEAPYGDKVLNGGRKFRVLQKRKESCKIKGLKTPPGT